MKNIYTVELTVETLTETTLLELIQYIGAQLPALVITKANVNYMGVSYGD